MSRIASFVLLATCFAVQLPVEAVETIHYPRPESARDKRPEYPVKLLELVLKKAGEPYRLSPSPIVMVQSRAFVELNKDPGLVDVVWSMTSAAREQQSLAIRIPIDKGLFGWRLLLVQKKKIDLFVHVRNLRDLAPFVAGLGNDWPDADIFQANGLAISKYAMYERLFDTLENGQSVQYLPRAVTEAWGEIEAHDGIAFAVANGIALHYPAAQYFFVRKNNQKLADVLRVGLERAIADGSFDRLFNKYFANDIWRADLEHRTILELTNPLLSPDTPLNRKELWFRAPHKH